MNSARALWVKQELCKRIWRAREAGLTSLACLDSVCCKNSKYIAVDAKDCNTVPFVVNYYNIQNCTLSTRLWAFPSAFEAMDMGILWFFQESFFMHNCFFLEYLNNVPTLGLHLSQRKVNSEKLPQVLHIPHQCRVPHLSAPKTFQLEQAKASWTRTRPTPGRK